MMNDLLQSFISSLSQRILLSICEELQPILFQEANSSILRAAFAAMNKDHLEEPVIIDQSSQSLQALDEEHLRTLLTYILLDRTSVELIYESLSKYECDVLAYFIFHVERDFLSYRKIEQGLTGYKPHTFRLGLIGLRRKGLIYTLRRQWGEEGYVFPSDLQTAFYQYLLYKEDLEGFAESTDAVRLPTEQIQTSAPVIGRDKPAPIFQLIFFLLDDLRQIKSGTVPLTQKGTIHKRYVRIWEEVVGDNTFSLQEFDVSLEHQDTYSTKLAILLDYLTRKNLISWGQEELIINLAACNQYMHQSRAEILRDFKEYWFEYYVPKQKWMQSYYRDARLMSQTYEWLPVLHFVERWEAYYQLPPIQGLIEKIKQGLLDPLYRFGLIEYALSGHQELLWRWTLAAEQETEVWLQPNLECLCSSLTPLPLLWKLTQILALKGWDQMLVLQPSEQKLALATEQGVSLQAWLEWLRSLTKFPIPDEFAEYLKGMERKTQQVLIQDTILITVSDPHLLKALVQYCTQSDIQGQALSDTQLVVQKQEEERVLSFLRQNQISIQDAKRTGESADRTEKEQSYVQRMEQGGPLLFSRVTAQEKLKVESVFPSFTEAIPAWNQFPDMWKKQLLSYHERTKREILDQAIEHQLLIQYESSQGELVTMKPIANHTLAGEWICVAENRGKIPLQDMKRMQLLFPDLTQS